MSVYVDDVEHKFGNMLMCHLWADTHSELLEMVDKIGVKRRWLQKPPKASWVHFDIAKSKKALAIAAGAILTDRYGPALHTAMLKGNEAMIHNILRMRERNGTDAATGMGFRSVEPTGQEPPASKRA